MNSSAPFIQKPAAGEFNPYFSKYIDLVPEGDFFALMKRNTEDTIRFFRDVPEDKQDYRYAEGKWSIKQVFLHVIDTERVFTYRALVSARGDNKSPLPPVDENLYAETADVSKRNMESLIEEFMVVRRSAEILFETITAEQSTFRGNGAGYPITARALGYIMMGHVIHHMNVVRDRYLS